MTKDVRIVTVDVSKALAPAPEFKFEIYRHEDDFFAAGGVAAIAKRLEVDRSFALVFLHSFDIAKDLDFSNQDRFVAWYVGNITQKQRKNFIDYKIDEYRNIDFTKKHPTPLP
jgi:hypothetical protein